MIWFIEDPLRYRQERAALDALASSAAWLLPGEWRIDDFLRVMWDADILVGDARFPVRLRYPSHFPHSPPLVLPRGVTERWSSHQYGPGGELCLEFGPDNWHPDMTGAEMIQSAYRLLHGERPEQDQRGRVASRHATTLGQDLAGKHLRLVVTRPLIEFLSSLQERHVLQGNMVCAFHDKEICYAVESVQINEGKWVDPTIPSTIVAEGHESGIALLRWPGSASLPEITTWTGFCGALRGHSMELPDTRYALLTHNECLSAYLRWKDDDTASSISIIPPPAAASRLDEDHAALSGRRVAIIGCGSLGSKVAAMLARSGVGRFLLVDDDLMFPDNLVRQELDWRDMGSHKADGVARRIRLVKPAAQCDARRYRMGGQQSSGRIESLIATVAECDLIIDATADARAFNYICAAVAVGKKPLVWAQVFAGGVGGMVARHRPGIEPDPASMRAIIEQWCNDRGKPSERAGEDYDTRGSGPPLIADDADVTVIAGHAARFAIDALMPRSPSLFPNAAYMIGLAPGWIFDQPFETYPIDVGSPLPTFVDTDQSILDEERAHILAMFKKFSDENSSAPAADQAPGA